jgi:hypothetical protein
VVPKAPRVHHAEVACLTPGLVAATLAPRIDAAGVAALGYVLADGHWWQRGPVQEVGGLFGLVTRTVRGDGATAEQVYDSDQLVVTAQIDALGLSTTSLIDYRVMAPTQTIDPNGTTRSAVHDGFGRVVASGVEGHVGAQPWKSGTAIGWAPGGGDGRVRAGGSGGLSRGRGDRDVHRRPRVGARCDAHCRGDGGAQRAGR